MSLESDLWERVIRDTGPLDDLAHQAPFMSAEIRLDNVCAALVMHGSLGAISEYLKAAQNLSNHNDPSYQKIGLLAYLEVLAHMENESHADTATIGNEFFAAYERLESPEVTATLHAYMERRWGQKAFEENFVHSQDINYRHQNIRPALHLAYATVLLNMHDRASADQKPPLNERYGHVQRRLAFYLWKNQIGELNQRYVEAITRKRDRLPT